MDSEQHTRRKAGSASESPASKSRTGPGRRTPSQTRQRSIELLDKALDLFLENGFERTSIDGITAAVGMAKRTVYLRYGNKTKLFKAALQRAIEEWIIPVERLRAVETDDAEATLLKIGEILVTNILSPGGLRLMRITNAESGRMPEIGAFTFKQGTAPTIAYLTDLVRRRIRPGGAETRDPEEAAKAFLYLVVGGPASMTAWGIALNEQEIQKHTRYAVHLFLHGLLNFEGSSVLRSEVPSGRAARKQAAISHASPSDVQAASRLKALEEENRRLKMLLAESMLETATLKER
jgi:TetR/AcrR family transcriptional repressor of mexJK operon